MRTFLLAAMLLFTAVPGAAQQPATQSSLPQQPVVQQKKRPAPCTREQHRQFDFWIGEWHVIDPSGKTVGHSNIEPRLNRCVIHEHWQGGGGSDGESFNLYIAATEQWEQFWVDNGGNRLHLKGGLVDWHMVLSGEQDKPDAQTGIVQRERITWTPNADGSVRQFWETSKDDGKTWEVSFDGLYRRVAKPPAQE